MNSPLQEGAQSSTTAWVRAAGRGCDVPSQWEHGPIYTPPPSITMRRDRRRGQGGLGRILWRLEWSPSLS